MVQSCAHVEAGKERHKSFTGKINGKTIRTYDEKDSEEKGKKKYTVGYHNGSTTNKYKWDMGIKWI